MRPIPAMMLSVPTLYVVFVVNFLALGMVWTYVLRSYPSFAAARYWSLATYVASAGAGVSLLRSAMDPRGPVIASGAFLILACWIAAMGVERFYGRKPSWRLAVVVNVVSCAALALFSLWRDDIAMRVFIHSASQSLPFALTLPLLFAREDGRINPGARLAGLVSVLVIVVHAVRAVAALIGYGGTLSLSTFNGFQAAMVLLLVFLSMAWNFGFLLMSIDRLRSEIADLAMRDDLTGAANRRLLLQRFHAACADAARSGEPFALLAIDLDGFKAVNDSHGHAAGDECLRQFTQAAQRRLRPGDLLARVGGDEFWVLLPATTLREGGMMARRLLEACRQLGGHWGDTPTLSASIGVAQWRTEIGHDVDRLIAAADHALYIAKKSGKNGYSLFQEPPAPEPLRRTA